MICAIYICRKGTFDGGENEALRSGMKRADSQDREARAKTEDKDGYHQGNASLIASSDRVVS